MAEKETKLNNSLKEDEKEPLTQKQVTVVYCINYLIFFF